MNIRSCTNLRKEILNSKLNEFVTKVQQKIKNSESYRATPKKIKPSLSKKLVIKKPPISSKTPTKQLGFDSTALNKDSLKQLQTFSSGSDEKIQKLKQKLKASKLLISKYQSELLKAYERITELESIVKISKSDNSSESTHKIFKK